MPNEKPFDTPRPTKTDGIGRQLDDGLAGTVSAAQAVPSGSAPEPIDWDKEPPPPLDHYENGVPTTVRQQPETIGERLKRIYPEHYVRIITLTNKDNGPEHTARLLEYTAPRYACVLALGFIWNNTVEGHDYWNKLSERERS